MTPPQQPVLPAIRSGPVAARVYLWTGVALGLVGVAQLLSQSAESLSWVAVVAALAAGAAVVALPRAVLPAVVVLAAAVGVMVAVIEVPVFATFLAVMVAAFTLARYARPRVALLGYGVLVGTVVVVAVPEITASGEGAFGLIYPVFYFGGAGLLGWLTRQRARHVLALHAYAETLERERRHQVELAAAAERERLARDMHDVVSHGVSLMVVQAEAAREVLTTRPDAAAVALDAIADAGRVAMRDLHRMIGLLRAPDADLQALVGSVRATGLAVDLTIDGDWATVAEPVRGALFRVTQESLTNTLRHARGVTQVTITVDCERDPASVEILDDGQGTTGFDHGSGTGLGGLSDRLGVLGGVLVSGPRPDGPGFRVRAEVALGAS